MSEQANDSISGTLTIAGLPEQACFTTFKELLLALPNYLKVTVNASVRAVITSSSNPNEDQRDAIWNRRDVSGNTLGLYTYQKGGWKPAYNFAPGQIIWLYASDGVAPEGFQKVDSANGAVTAEVAAALAATYIKNSTDVDVYFAVTYVGF